MQNMPWNYNQLANDQSSLRKTKHKYHHVSFNYEQSLRLKTIEELLPCNEKWTEEGTFSLPWRR